MLKKILAVSALALSMAAPAHAAMLTLDSPTIIKTTSDGSQTFTTVIGADLLSLESTWNAGSNGNDLHAIIDFGVDMKFDLTLNEIIRDVAVGNSSFQLRKETSTGGFDLIQGTTSFPAAGTTLFSALEAGFYRFTFIENNNTPPSGSFVLGITPVPVPGAGILLGSVLAGAAAVRLRRSRKTRAA